MSVLKARINGQWVPLNGSDEVYVGPSDPTIASTELWVDTDEPNVMTQDMRWNTSWGIVGMGAFKAGVHATVINSGSVITDPISFTSVTGRRYRVRCTVRALEPTTVPSGMYSAIRKNGTSIGDQHSTFWAAVGSGYAAPTIEALFTGDGTTASWDVVVFTAGSAATGFRAYVDAPTCNFYIEDVGPIGGSVSMVPPSVTGAWVPLTPVNGWTALGSGRPPNSCRLVGDTVDLRVAVKGGNQGTACYELPAAFRPPYTLDFIGRDGGGGGIFNITSVGTVTWYGTQANNTFVALNCSYPVTP